MRSNKEHIWQRTVNAFVSGEMDAYEHKCTQCGETAWIETGRRGAVPQDLPATECKDVK